MSLASGTEVMRHIHNRLPEIEVRDEQVEALDAIAANEDAGNNASLMVMPPGTGKTIVMAADTLRRLWAQPDARGLFLCDQNDITEQAAQTFEQVIGGEFSYGLFTGDRQDVGEFSVLFGGFQIMRRRRTLFPQDNFNFGIVDESHHAKAATYEPTLDYYRFAHLLGATATPDRHDTLDIRDIFGPEVYTLKLEDAISRRLLASVDYYVITDELVETGVVKDDHGNGYYMRDFDRNIFAPERDKKILEAAGRYADQLEKPKTIGFCKSIEQAEHFAQMFNELFEARGREAAAYHSGLPRREQRRLLNEYRQGNLGALFTVSMFDEGIDIPEANQILFLRATDSKRIYLQELGRGLRKTKVKKRVQVLDFVDNAERLLLVDKVWSGIARAAGQTEPFDGDVLEIDMNHVHFNESARNALRILRTINKKVYRPDQVVPAGSYLASRLARDLRMSTPVLLTLSRTLGIKSEKFPRQSGAETPFFLADDVARIREAADHLWSRN